MAHPDDPELWAGGTLAHHARLGAPVVAAVTAHDQIRNAEAAAGADVLGIRLEQPPSLDAETVGELIHRHRPDILITHPVNDVHPDHRAATAAVLAALPTAHIATGRPRRLYTCDTYNSLTLAGPLHAAVIVDVTSTFEQKMQALARHASQPIDQHFAPMARTLAALWGSRIGTPHAEAFTPLPILGRLPGAPHL